MRRRTRDWIIDTIAGAVPGGIVGAVVAVNVVIYLGPDTGYQSSIDQVFRQNALVGLVAGTALLGGPTFGVVVARRLRHRRDLP